MKNVNRVLSNGELIKEIESQFDMEYYSEATIYVLTFEESGLMDVKLYFDDEYLESDIVSVENDMIALQKVIKEIGTLIAEKYNIVPDVKIDLFDGLKLECVF